MTIRRRSGTALALGLVLLAPPLAGCVGEGDGQPSTSPSPPADEGVDPSTSASVSPSPGPSLPAGVAAIPGSCETLVAPDVYAAVFAGQTLNGPGFGGPFGALEPTPAAAGASGFEVLDAATELHCIWGDSSADVTQLNTSIGRADPAVVDAFFSTLPAEGYTCDETLDGERCQRVRQNEQYPVEEAQTIFAREGVFVRIYQANFPTDDLLGSIVTQIWG